MCYGFLFSTVKFTAETDKRTNNCSGNQNITWPNDGAKVKETFTQMQRPRTENECLC